MSADAGGRPPDGRGAAGPRAPHARRRAVPALARPAPAMPLWGALWAIALGAWLIAPRLLRAHHLTPGTAGEWAVLAGFLVSALAVLGAASAFFAGLAVVPLLGARRDPEADARWPLALAAGPITVLGYGLTSVLVELRQFGTVTAAEPARLAAGAAALAALAAVAARLGHRLAGRSPGLLATALAVVAGAGLAALPLRTERGGGAAPSARAAALPRTATNRAPVLLVGIDGGDWRSLDPLLAAGRLPEIAALAGGGMRGEVTALWPPFWSAPAWAAILTGHGRRETGVWEDLHARAPGLPAFEAPLEVDLALNPLYALEYALVQAGVVRLEHHRREALARPPIWEILSASGVTSGVIRFRFTHPAGGAEVVVSDSIGEDQWRLMFEVAADPDPAELVAPPELAREVVEIFGRPRAGRERLAGLVEDPHRPPPAGVVLDPLDMLAIALDVDEATIEAAEAALRHRPGLGLLAVYLGGFDTVGHAFFPYRFPEDFPAAPPAAADVAALGGVVDRYWQRLDDWIGRLRRAFPVPPAVVLVADHGHEAIEHHSLWRGWHARRGGIFVAGGPGVPARADRLAVSYYDVLPTLLDLAGVAAPEDLKGRSLLTVPPR